MDCGLNFECEKWEDRGSLAIDSGQFADKKQVEILDIKMIEFAGPLGFLDLVHHQQLSRAFANKITITLFRFVLYIFCFNGWVVSYDSWFYQHTKNLPYSRAKTLHQVHPNRFFRHSQDAIIHLPPHPQYHHLISSHLEIVHFTS